MKLGPIQKLILTFLSRCDREKGAFIGSTKAEELAGLDLEQVERALAGLLRRNIIKREGIRYIMNDNRSFTPANEWGITEAEFEEATKRFWEPKTPKEDKDAYWQLIRYWKRNIFLRTECERAVKLLREEEGV